MQKQFRGGGQSLFVKNDNTAWACGKNDDAELGDGTQIDRFSPKQVLTNVTSVSGGHGFSLFLKSDNTVWAAGTDSNGQFANGSGYSFHPFPVQITTQMQAISAGEKHSLFLNTDGSAWVAGSGIYGQIGSGGTVDQTTIRLIMPSAKFIAAGGYHTLLVKSDGTAWATGSNTSSQLGNGSDVDRLTITQILTDVKAVAGGRSCSLFLKTDDSVHSSGFNGFGQLGDGSTTQRSTPVMVLLPPSLSNPLIGGITNNGANLMSSVTSENGYAVTSRGFVYSQTATNPNPRIGETGVTNVSVAGTTGNFSKLLSTLAANTSYTFRAHATNAHGIGYSQELSFRTAALDVQIERLDGVVITHSTGGMEFLSVRNTPLSQTLTVRNTGSGTINSMAVSLSGSDSTSFKVITQPASVLPTAGTSTFTIEFNGIGTGQKQATLSLTNNVPTKNP